MFQASVPVFTPNVYSDTILSQLAEWKVMVIVRVHFRKRQIPKSAVISPRVRLLSAFGSVCFHVSHRHLLPA